ncbi:hypothetical protein D3C85_1141460 [compost metagenome]
MTSGWGPEEHARVDPVKSAALRPQSGVFHDARGCLNEDFTRFCTGITHDSGRQPGLCSVQPGRCGQCHCRHEGWQRGDRRSAHLGNSGPVGRTQSIERNAATSRRRHWRDAGVGEESVELDRLFGTGQKRAGHRQAVGRRRVGRTGRFARFQRQGRRAG